MEFMISWFWVIHLLVDLLVIVLIWFGYKSYKRKNIKSVIFIFVLILGMIIGVNSVKIDSTNSHRGRALQTYSIENNKAIPPKTTDDSFKNETESKKLQITKKDIWE